MTANDRRMAILEVLCERRHDNVMNLAFEFGVSRNTIKNDIVVLSCSYPIYTVQGVGGGIYVADGYRLGKKYLTEKQEQLLRKIGAKLTGEDAKVMAELLKTFVKPKRG